MSNLNVKIEGLDELVRNLRKLPKELQGKPLQSAVGKAARTVRDEAKSRAAQGTYTNRSSNAPDPGRLYDNIIAAKRRRLKPDEMEYLVMVRTKGKKNDRRNAWYWFMLEFGTSKMSARPFMRPAFETKKRQALKVMIDGIRKGIDRVAKKLVKK